VSIVERYREGFHIGFFGLSASDGALIDALEKRARHQRQLFVVTLGEDGSLVLGGAKCVSCPAVAVAQVMDTTGAGDTFAAGFLREYAVSRDPARSLARGAEEAAVSVQRVGAFPWDD
jgi:sugar/nucleoside kinase (ribokinase family)